MTCHYSLAVIAAEHDKALIKSLLASFGDRGDNQWSYGEDIPVADVVIVDFEHYASSLPLRLAKPGHVIVAYAPQAGGAPTPFMLAKPLRGREFVKLLERLEDVLKAEDEDEFAKTHRRIVF